MDENTLQPVSGLLYKLTFIPMKTDIFTPEQSLLKIKQYCAYQERCKAEVKEKLHSFGLDEASVEGILSNLTDERYLNEERYSIHFAIGKFSLKRWGKIKIKYALKQKGVSERLIKMALEHIDENEYQKILLRLAEQKIKTLKNEKSAFNKKVKLKNFLLQKGYESKLIKEIIEKIK